MIGALTDTVGLEFTVTGATAVSVQPAVVLVTVYVVVVVNAAVLGFDIDTKPPVQLYVVAPLAVNVVLSPLQILGLFTVTVGLGFTVTVAIAVPVQPLVVPITVYVVVVVSAAVLGFDIGANPPVQLYVVAPLAVNVVLSPLQILGLLTVTVGFGFTVTVAIAVPVQPAVVPVTVYVVVVGKAAVVG